MRKGGKGAPQLTRGQKGRTSTEVEIMVAKDRLFSCHEEVELVLIDNTTAHSCFIVDVRQVFFTVVSSLCDLRKSRVRPAVFFAIFSSIYGTAALLRSEFSLWNKHDSPSRNTKKQYGNCPFVRAAVRTVDC